MLHETRTLGASLSKQWCKILGSTVRDVPELAKEASAFWNVSSDDAPSS